MQRAALVRRGKPLEDGVVEVIGAFDGAGGRAVEEELAVICNGAVGHILAEEGFEGFPGVG